MNGETNTKLQRFYRDAHFRSKMGHNCLWSNASLLLRYCNGERYALPYLDIGPLYGGPNLDSDFLNRLEKLKEEQSTRLEPLFTWRREQYDPASLRLAIDRPDRPRLLRVDPYILHSRHPVFPPDHDYHYLVVCGVVEEEVCVLDQYFGFKGMLPYELLEQAVFSPAISGIGEVLTLELCDEGDETPDMEWLNRLFYQKLEAYLKGSVLIDGVHHDYGLQSLIRFHKELPLIFSSFFRQHQTREEALGLLSRRINIFMTNEREGMAHYLRHHADFLPRRAADELAALLLQSARKMKQISYALTKAQLRQEETGKIIAKIMKICKDLLFTEIEVHYAIEQSLYCNRWNNRTT
ncbi:hypothetical protein LOK74_08330 [Brevibacillus humidisoli]|uniref:hypothetical protein n=1 Tax=Brevibacillus humidisoli TaxID=2895522 RepID=UPI001E5CF5E2|nr:hypothetical protein [Brevibacillus humidisoli]UFJ42481.1 hypothetical protein LOK74_08330 [Brevibacillus humidisoli]